MLCLQDAMAESRFALEFFLGVWIKPKICEDMKITIRKNVKN
jgi:hypothetical protein